jgi:hypothetical protein
VKRRRRWRQPNNPTAPARQVWAALFPGEPWPAGWRVQWAGFMRGALGLTLYDERRLLLSWGDHVGPKVITRRHSWTVYADGRRERSQRPRPGVVDTLIHEFVHVRCGKALRHGKEFTRLENGLRTRLGLEDAT